MIESPRDDQGFKVGGSQRAQPATLVSKGIEVFALIRPSLYCIRLIW